jgi:uncharacterized membrane protein
MTLLSIIQKFPDEDTCRLHYKTLREKQGIVCKKCACEQHYWLKTKWMWQCKQCNYRTSLKNGTAFQHSNLPLRMWFMTMALMSFSRKAVSACEIQRQLQHSRYDTIWSLMHRIRNIMGNHIDNEMTNNLDNQEKNIFILASPEGIDLKRSKNALNILDVINMLFSDFVMTDDSGSYSTSQNSAMHLDTHKVAVKVKSMDKFIDCDVVFDTNHQENIDISAILEHVVHSKSFTKTQKKSSKAISLAFENLTGVLESIYHKAKLKYLQLYIDEFCFKYNYRWIKEHLFEKLMVASLQNIYLQNSVESSIKPLNQQLQFC